jgi:transcriptional antiterminator
LAKQTGSPKQLSEKLELSERNVHYYIAFMKNEMKAPIIYDTVNETYLYETECKISFIGQ